MPQWTVGASRIECHRLVFAGDAELRLGDADLRQHARDLVAAAEGHGDPGHVAFDLILREPSQLGVGQHIVLTGDDRWDDDFTAPLAELDHEWDVGARGSVEQSELALVVRDGRDEG